VSCVDVRILMGLREENGAMRWLSCRRFVRCVCGSCCVCTCASIMCRSILCTCSIRACCMGV